MIKLVAADMDGTLLNSKKELSPKLFPTIERLHENKIKFAVASGRQYYNLLNIYDELKDEVTFIAENGAIVFDKGENIFYDEMSKEDIINILKAVSKIENAYPVLCGLNSAYIQGNVSDEFERHVDMYYSRCERVPDLFEAINRDHICKVAIYDSINAETNTYPLLKSFIETHKVSISGHEWVDLMNPTVNKGVAINLIREKYGIGFDETMAFGDYLNDYEMMGSCHHSYAMANAHPLLKEVANFEAPSNDDDGVVVVLESYLESIK